MNLLGDQGQVLVQRLGKRNDRVLGDVVDAHVRRVQHAGHRSGVDDVALVTGVSLRSGQHHRGEQAHAVDDAHHVDAQHPLPIGDGVLPHQAAGTDTGVVEDEMRRAETLLDGGCERLHLVRL